MAKEAVFKVKEAEERGAEIIKSASEQARKIIASAENDATAAYKKALDEIKKEREGRIIEALEVARAECQRYDEANAAEVAKILSPDRKAYIEAVNAAKGRVVS